MDIDSLLRPVLSAWSGLGYNRRALALQAAAAGARRAPSPTRRGAAGGPRGGEVQPGEDGARRTGLHSAAPALRRVPDRHGMRIGRRGRRRFPDGAEVGRERLERVLAGLERDGLLGSDGAGALALPVRAITYPRAP